MSTSDPQNPNEPDTTTGVSAEPSTSAGEAAEKADGAGAEVVESAAPATVDASDAPTTKGDEVAGAAADKAAATPEPVTAPATPPAPLTPPAPQASSAPPAPPGPPTTPAPQASSAPPAPPAAAKPTAPPAPPAAPVPSAAPDASTRPPLTASKAGIEEEAARHAAARPTPLPPEPSPRFTTGAAARAAEVSSTPDPVVTPVNPVATGTAGTTSAAPAATAGAAAGTAAGAAAAGAAARPAAPSTTTTPETRTGAHAAPIGAAASAAGPATPPGPTPEAEGGTGELFPDPNAPRSMSIGTHLLGVLVGLVLPAVAAVITLLGNSRILVVEAPDWGARVDTFGIVLTTLGVLLLGAVALLCIWTPWVGYIGGTILTLAGGFALYAPGIARYAVLDVLSNDAWHQTVSETIVSATSGVLFAVGVLLLATAIVAHVAHRHGLRLGTFRERHRA